MPLGRSVVVAPLVALPVSTCSCCPCPASRHRGPWHPPPPCSGAKRDLRDLSCGFPLSKQLYSSCFYSDGAVLGWCEGVLGVTSEVVSLLSLKQKVGLNASALSFPCPHWHCPSQSPGPGPTRFIDSSLPRLLFSLLSGISSWWKWLLWPQGWGHKAGNDNTNYCFLFHAVNSGGGNPHTRRN